MLIDDFNKTLDVWLEDLYRYDIETLRIQPDPSSWSLGQLYRHLIEETSWYFAQLEICLENPENSTKEMTPDAKAMFQKNSFPDELIKGDPFISASIKQPVSLQSLQNEFVQLKKNAASIWMKIEKSKTYGKSQHPGFQFLTPREWFQYAEMHMRHQLKQKSRIELFLKSRQ